MRRLLLALALAITTTSLSACGSDKNTGPQVAPLVDLSGRWSFEVTVTFANEDCEGEADGTTWVESATLSQSGSDITGTGRWSSDTGRDYTLRGKVRGYEMTLSGFWGEDFGTTFSTFRLRANAAGDSLVGVEEWSWASAEYSCSRGESDVIATRVVP